MIADRLRRWAFVKKSFEDNNEYLLGKYAWPHARLEDPQIRTFATRREAREARATCCYKKVRIVRVDVSVVVSQT